MTLNIARLNAALEQEDGEIAPQWFEFRDSAVHMQRELLDHVHKVASPATHRDLLTLNKLLVEFESLVARHVGET